MRNILKQLIIITISLFIFNLPVFNVDAEDIDKGKSDIITIPNNKIKVGFYNYYPYFYLNSEGEPSGYYNDLLELITKELDIEFEYVDSNFDEVVNALGNGDIDLLFGINRTTDRLNNLIFTDFHVAIENFSIYTSKDISYGKLEDLNGLKFAYIENEANSEWILDFFNSRGINVVLVPGSSYEHVNKLLIDGKVDATLSASNNNELNKFKAIFDFSAGPVYIASKKGNENLISSINNVYMKFSEMNPSPIDKLGQEYFNKYAKINRYISMLTILLIFVIIAGAAYLIYKSKSPKIMLQKKQSRIRDNILSDKYLLHYQPIVNPKNEKIMGFEALLRMRSENKILSPYYFIKDIEECEMMHEVSLWILKKVISDYEIIKQYNCVKNDNFYISINISFKEIENDSFVNEFINISKGSNIKPNTICLEIVEKYAIKDFLKIQFAISKLQKSGYLVAIDDFGVEYSNLDILEKLDCNIVKIDKYFVDNIKDSITRREIIRFISQLCKLSNKILVSEGVEHSYQRDLIRNIDNEKFYIQGYYYSKPLNINDLENFII